MNKKLALLGCGNFGYELAGCLSQSVGDENLYLTNRNVQYRKEFCRVYPNVTSDNQEAIDTSHFVCILAQPQEVDALLDEVHIPTHKVIVNFSPKRLSVNRPLIQVACSPVVEGRVRALLYEKNNHITNEQLQCFRHIFSPVSDYFAECDDSVRELGVMSQVYAHLIRYFEVFVNEGFNQDAVRAYFQLACDSLGEPKEKVRTRKGITEALFEFEKENLPHYVNNESRVLKERLQWIQGE